MALDLPETEQSVIDAAKSDVQASLPGSAPFLPNSFIGATTTGVAARVHDFYRVLKIAERETWWDTATDESLDRWGSILGLTRNPSAQASGKIAITGTAGFGLGSGIKFRSTSGQLYTTTTTATITAFSSAVDTITRSGSLVTVKMVDNHELANGISVTMAGADQADYNGTFSVAVTGDKTFTYTIAGTPVTPATGTITADYTSALIDIISDEGGKDQNLDSGAALVITASVAGIDDNAKVAAVAVTGGTDIESDSDYRSRIGEEFRGIPANFNADQINRVAREVPGVTRVFVEEATPYAGQVTVYFLRDNDDDIIPDAAEVTAVSDAINAIRPASMLEEDVIVSAPTGVPVNFSIGSINPNTSTMKTAIENRINQLFREGVSVGVDLTQDAYRGAIFGTVDTVTGQALKGFVVTAPTGDISIATGEIPVLGTVSIT